MSGTKKQPVALHATLLEGLTVKSRPDGSVVTVKGADGKATVAELCIGSKRTRVNFRETPKSALAKQLSKGTKSWPAGGVILTDANASAVRAALLAVAQPRKATPATPRRKTTAVRKRSRKAGAAA